jgi:hypothetical protein
LSSRLRRWFARKRSDWWEVMSGNRIKGIPRARPWQMALFVIGVGVALLFALSVLLTDSEGTPGAGGPPPSATQ